ncbi:winged helix-turn-helix transcriptional regulator [Sneathiella chinensis]|uniref:Transcriptional regulator n=1 Tax=Sneathiella chinensis TaxID=349750 RepID=A0ABQ5U475_9PROT|nr:helix-turn-helix domain-containing protein [Sneathiella chinensis]GLQ06541.1 transcriptional regulator [Sneathiella chinensis]
MKWQELNSERCSIARALYVVGDRWTILVLRECYRGVTRFDKFESRLKIPRRILSERLKKLVEEGLLVKEQYQNHRLRFDYLLTDKGWELRPVLLSLLAWGDKYLAEGEPPMSLRHEACGHVTVPALVCSACGEPVDPREIKSFPTHKAAPKTEAG